MEKKNKTHIYEVYRPIMVEVRTIIEASSEQEALELSKQRHISICRHGNTDGDAEETFVIVGDAPAEWEGGNLNAYINDIL